MSIVKIKKTGKSFWNQSESVTSCESDGKGKMIVLDSRVTLKMVVSLTGSEASRGIRQNESFRTSKRFKRTKGNQLMSFDFY